MKLLLTGERGVGKSTVLNRTLAQLDTVLGGFRTGFDPEGKRLCLWSAWENGDYDRSRTIAHRNGDHLDLCHGSFDRLGPPTLAVERALYVLDELGRAEEEEWRFKEAVMARLTGSNSVLGAIKLHREGSWLAQVEALPDVELILVTPENRDALPAELADRLRRSLGI